MDEYNILSEGHLWTGGLNTAFYDEILSRLIDEGTFSISIVWYTTQEWMNKPYVRMQVGFENEYRVMDRDNAQINPEDKDISHTFVTNDQLSDELQKFVLQYTLGFNLLAVVNVQGQELRIVGIEKEDPSGPQDLLPFYPREELDQMAGQFLRVPLSIEEYPDFAYMRMMINGLIDKSYDVVDPYLHTRERYLEGKEYLVRGPLTEV